jgi:integrase
MAKKMEAKKIRGVFERPEGSGVWWIQYFENGNRHREKVGRKSDAVALYQVRKAAITKGEKLPDLQNGKVTLSALIDDALEYAKTHASRFRDYESKAEIVRGALGARVASTITPQEVGAWLSKHCKTPATANRYRAFLSLVYREAIANKKQDSNPARGVRQRKEPRGRLRFLTREEYDSLCAVIRERFPEHLAEFIVSVNSGMRLSEQYTCTWSQVDFKRRAIDLTKTKNGTARTIHLNPDALAAVESMKAQGQKPSDRVFPNGQKDFVTRSWFVPCLEAAGISGYVWHSNRHTFCSWLAMAGATIKEIQELAGHKTISMSARYAHLSPDHKLSVIDRISSSTATV